MSQVLASRPPVRIEDPDEPFLREAEDVAVAFINLALPDRESSTKKAPVYPKKTAGEPGLLRAEEGEGPQADQPPTELVPASLPLLEVTQIQQGRVSSSAAGGATADGTAVSRQVSGKAGLNPINIKKSLCHGLVPRPSQLFLQCCMGGPGK